MAKIEVQRIADQLDRAVGGPAWHGPSMLEALKGVTSTQAAARPLPGAHSIQELVAHATAWLEIVRQRVQGTAPDRISAAMDWPAVAPGGGDWDAAVARLRSAGGDLAGTIRSLDDGRLPEDLPGEDDTWSVYVTLHGVIQHLLYHAGQIAVLKKGARP
jgi:hypothetical protein